MQFLKYLVGEKPPLPVLSPDTTIIGASTTTLRQRTENRLRIYKLALKQNEKGPERAKVLKGYIKTHELRLKALELADEASKEANVAEQLKG